MADISDYMQGYNSGYADGGKAAKERAPAGTRGALATVNPWVPMTDPKSLKLLGKLGEEVNELGAAVFRCIIQGIEEREPVTGKLNRRWLCEEIADVRANLDLVEKGFDLDQRFITERQAKKKAYLQEWLSMMVGAH